MKSKLSMKIEIVSLFPEVCEFPLSKSIMGRAQESGLLELKFHDLRDYAEGKHKQVDDIPYGGGQGMVLKPEPFFKALENITITAETKVVLMTPQGEKLTQQVSQSLSDETHLVILCGHYEGVDHRVIEELVDVEISIGDYVLSNGAIAATVLVDSIVRLIPGVLGDERSAVEESFSDPNLLEAPVYTRPATFGDKVVPEVLLSGNHKAIEEWKVELALNRTKKNRPDLLDQ